MARTQPAVGREVLAIRRSLASIGRALARLVPALQAAVRAPKADGGRRRKLRLSPARRRALKKQGQYMGYLRSLKPRQKAQVKSLRSAKGVSAAIALAKEARPRPDTGEAGWEFGTIARVAGSNQYRERARAA